MILQIYDTYLNSPAQNYKKARQKYESLKPSRFCKGPSGPHSRSTLGQFFAQQLLTRPTSLVRQVLHNIIISIIVIIVNLSSAPKCHNICHHLDIYNHGGAGYHDDPNDPYGTLDYSYEHFADLDLQALDQLIAEIIIVILINVINIAMSIIIIVIIIINIIVNVIIMIFTICRP